MKASELIKLISGLEHLEDYEVIFMNYYMQPKEFTFTFIAEITIHPHTKEIYFRLCNDKLDLDDVK